MPDIEKLGELEFTLETISDFSELEGLVSPQDLEEAREKADERYRRYIEKLVLGKGAYIPLDGRVSVREFFIAEAYLDTYLKVALTSLGLDSKARRDYHSIPPSIVRRLRKQKPILWPRFLYGLYSMWAESGKFDPKIVRIVVMLTAKVFYQFRFGKLRPPEPSERDLYPELEAEA
ncbi:MAG: hypothetical protein ACXQTW_04700 [Candidatus Methanospirareceae archaeon]